ncbi:DNA-3-methyladenine glycosylase I [Campylobacter gastrosuis]|uniref:DNA-3-methyladenine glycosylase I n=1 Tax=Campylobacter gastrosuis TaxID=2974576 RepID=A0ABT7HQ73_9BACT|nr:DNA-3-methyladenine glycosylase I [Campylobacter gastrosuis]MDL0088820.1 DNA-3-methyladenine glycosylase I [Campylobacter gastrosuis]
MKKRCEWCEKDELYRAYHDDEWGEIVRDERVLFEFLVLETMQAGLSWHTILKKREAMRVAFDDFDYHKIALYDDKKVEILMQNDKILKNRLKLKSLSQNAVSFMKIQSEFGSFYAYIWGFINNKQIVLKPQNLSQINATSPLSDEISKDMKKRGFKFVGSTTIYSFLQAVGVISEHLAYCFKFKG